jgi:hypothetical protein
MPAPARRRGRGLQYAVIGWGFAVGGFVLAQTITATAPQLALSIVGGIVAAIALISLLLPTNRHRAKA